MNKRVYLFTEGEAGMKNLLGGKGANLAEMTKIGLPVPPGFTVTTSACNQYIASGEKLDEELQQGIINALKVLESNTGKEFGDPDNPLLVSVRSGAPISMPGMMDTILNLGLNDISVEGLGRITGNIAFARDCYRRFIQMFGEVVLKIDAHKFEQALESTKNAHTVTYDYQLGEKGFKEVIAAYKRVVKENLGEDFPQDPLRQLMLAVEAVFSSWNNQRAKIYRRINKIPDELGTAVNVQCMVFGNWGEDSGTGVAFTRDPSTGESKVYGEFLINAQGEDVVAGIRTPRPISELEQEMPAVYEEFNRVCQLLEKHYKDVQDIEFTVESGRLYLLQTRTGKRTAAAAVKIAYDMVEEGLIDKKGAVMRVVPSQLEQLLHRGIDPSFQGNEVAVGLPASPGAATGKAVFDADRAEEMEQEGEKVILIRPETTPDDIHGVIAAQGVLTSRGGMTSHAAVVARGMGKPCICGCESVSINLAARELNVQLSGITVKEKDLVSIDGATGRVFLGEVPLVEPVLSAEFEAILSWADDIRKLEVRANADNPQDAAKAREFGAKGIGLTRTEHMFMAQDRLPVVQSMILADSKEGREDALSRLLPMQQSDFYGILKAMDGFPVTIRLLDPPLHEFLPDLEDLLQEVTLLKANGDDPGNLKEKEGLLKKVRSLHEFNPMLGHRGCRLGIVYPEIYRMQARAIFQAAVQLIKEGFNLVPEVEIPLVGHVNELKLLRAEVEGEATAVMSETGVTFDYKVGTMIELPRACVTANQIAAEADFFSFGTNDLTQTTFGYSRDDAEGKFLHYYVENKVLPADPFITLDQEGVGSLIEQAVKLGMNAKPELEIGICGEHGGDPDSIDFCHRAGLSFVSCSPYRVPIARLAAAQAQINNPR